MKIFAWVKIIPYKNRSRTAVNTFDPLKKGSLEKEAGRNEIGGTIQRINFETGKAAASEVLITDTTSMSAIMSKADFLSFMTLG